MKSKGNSIVYPNRNKHSEVYISILLAISRFRYILANWTRLYSTKKRVRALHSKHLSSPPNLRSIVNKSRKISIKGSSIFHANLTSSLHFSRYYKFSTCHCYMLWLWEIAPRASNYRFLAENTANKAVHAALESNVVFTLCVPTADKERFLSGAAQSKAVEWEFRFVAGATRFAGTNLVSVHSARQLLNGQPAWRHRRSTTPLCARVLLFCWMHLLCFASWFSHRQNASFFIHNSQPRK